MADETVSEAFEALQRAIEDLNRAAGVEGIVTDWVLVTSQLSAESEGMCSSTGYVASENQPRFKTMGLLDYAHTAVKCEIEMLMKGAEH